MRVIRVVFLCLIGTLAATSVPVAGQGEPKHVLLLFDEDNTLPGLAVLDRALRATLSDGLGGNVEFFSESLNASQFPETSDEQLLRDYYAAKYGSRKLDLIVGVMGPSVTFLRRHADAFAPGVPVVFCGADAENLEPGTLPVRMTGLVARRVFAPTLDLALRLQPDTRRVFVVGGTSAFDRNLQATARREFEPFEKRVSFDYLTDLPMDDLLAAVSKVPPRSVILYLTMFRDGAGQTFVPHDVASRISFAAHVPVYVFLDQYLGLGPVGGYVYSLELHGKAAAEMGLRVLRGESPATMPIREVSDNQYMFDIRQLDRWKLDPRLLPAGSIIRFRELSVWDRYSVYIITAAALLVVQTLLIAGLYIQGARRRRAEAQLRSSFDRIREIGGRLLSAQETERNRIAAELHDDISQQLALLKLDLSLLTGMVQGQGQAQTVADEAVRYADGIATGIRDLSHRLYPAKLRLVGLVVALEGLIRELSHHSPVPSISFTHENVPAALSPDLTLCLFRVVQEALQNALKHSQAENVAVHLRGNSHSLTLTVVDDGAGFLVDEMWSQGLGLISMRERVEAIHGTFNVQSSPLGGTRLEADVPLGVGHNTSALAN